MGKLPRVVLNMPRIRQCAYIRPQAAEPIKQCWRVNDSENLCTRHCMNKATTRFWRLIRFVEITNCCRKRKFRRKWPLASLRVLQPPLIPNAKMTRRQNVGRVKDGVSFRPQVAARDKLFKRRCVSSIDVALSRVKMLQHPQAIRF